MKFVRYRSDNRIRTGVLDRTEKYVLKLDNLVRDKDVNTMQKVIENLNKEDVEKIQQAMNDISMAQHTELRNIKLCSPIDRPLHDILCVGVNYADHLTEVQKELDACEEQEGTVYFSKRANRLLGDGESIVSRPDLDAKLDYEVELAVIIGKSAKDISKEDAEEYIFGYSVFNDISSRGIQKNHGQWFKGKSLDTYSAMGPVILHKSALPFPVEVDVSSMVNGEVRQRSNTKHLQTDIPTIISELSQGMTLEAGDIIVTGTPAGVGMGLIPPVYMKRGDVIACEIPPIGKLINIVK